MAQHLEEKKQHFIRVGKKSRQSGLNQAKHRYINEKKKSPKWFFRIIIYKKKKKTKTKT